MAPQLCSPLAASQFFPVLPPRREKHHGAPGSSHSNPKSEQQADSCSRTRSRLWSVATGLRPAGSRVSSLLWPGRAALAVSVEALMIVVLAIIVCSIVGASVYVFASACGRLRPRSCHADGVRFFDAAARHIEIERGDEQKRDDHIHCLLDGCWRRLGFEESLHPGRPPHPEVAERAQ